MNTQRSIERYQAQTITLRQENEKLAQQLEIAGSGERIRNLAQNELGMLRRERAQTETIYIQAPDKRRGKRHRQSVRHTWKSSISCWVCSMCFILESERACVHREPPYESGWSC